MSQDKEIKLKASRKGTTIQFFSDAFDNSFSADTQLAYVLKDVNNIPTNLVFLNDTNFVYDRNKNNVFEIKNIPSNATIGRVKKEIIEQQLTPGRRNKINNKFINDIQKNYGSKFLAWTFFDEKEIDDYYAEIKIERSYDVLDTLTVRNNLIGTIPSQESTVGVVFGKLVARQRINDENGNKIIVPLSNVPVGVFNPSDEFPSITSTDDDGDRIRLNYKENSKEGFYFNRESYLFDYGDPENPEIRSEGFLKSDRSNVKIPDKFKYTTTTNENGEFILTNIPTGEQVFMFEVDLLKQGLTKDEVSLNFFPYPTEESANVDNVPHFFFRQIPITVVPSWGTFQTGYTELNVTADLDLRKWTTYIFPPVSVFGQKLEQAVVKSSNNRLKIEVRDMTLNGFPSSKTLTVAQVINDLDREPNQQYSWYNEYRQNRKKLEYINFGCNVLKMPANLYDPNGYKTDKDGNKTNLKGVWLTSYQFKMYVDEPLNRKTGAFREFVKDADGNFVPFTLSHFDLNFINTNDDNYKLSSTTVISPQIGIFPYERPWSINYPEPYKIPAKPTKLRIKQSSDRTLYNSNPIDIYYTNEPAYEDGDLIGAKIDTVSNPVGGIGVQKVVGTDIYFGNRISQVATTEYVYKYESGISWNEKYANGYEPYWDSTSGQLFGGFSQVVNGEKYQRLECGYGYFLKPEGWPRIVRNFLDNTNYVDIPYNPDYETGVGLTNYGDPENPGPGITPKGNHNTQLYSIYQKGNDVYNLDNQNFALCLDSRVNIKKGIIDIYRIVDSSPSNLYSSANFVIPTSVRWQFGAPPAPNNYSWNITNRGEVTVKIKNTFRITSSNKLEGVIYYTSSKGIKRANVGEIFELEPGHSMTTTSVNNQPTSGPTQPYAPGNWEFCLTLYNGYIDLPGNKKFNPLTNKYDISAYSIEVSYSGGQSGWRVGNNFEFTPKTIPDSVYIKTKHIQTSGKNKTYKQINYTTEGIGRTFGSDRDIKDQTGDPILGILAETSPGSHEE